MLIIDAREVREKLAWKPLIAALAQRFREGCEAPLRHQHRITVPNEPEATLLLMPAWTIGAYIGVKIVTVVPGNADRFMPAVAANYLLSSARTGEMLAMIDGDQLTLKRTAAASALAASYLARKNTEHLLMVGTGKLAPELVSAHASVRPIRRVTVWGRNPAHARGLAERLQTSGLQAQASKNLAAAVEQADIVSCATLSKTPLIHGEWLRPGVHIDLVGSFRPDMRESDDELMRRARIYVDTRTGAFAEAGDIVQALASNAISESSIIGDLFDLTRGTQTGRNSDEEITVFKSAGAALEDLAAAIMLYERVS